ncbi:uncharacterized protein LOC141895557 isoform X2 [Acropora palmata]
MTMKPRKKGQRIDKEEIASFQSKISVEENGSGDQDRDTELPEMVKRDLLEEAVSPENIMEQDLQSNDNSVSVDQGANTSLSKRLRMYKCERCKSQYMGLAMLRQHCKDVHGDQKYYKCNVCGKLFSHPSSRNIHLRLHSGEKPYKCSTCGKKFRVSSHLKDHVRVHTGERPYICDICHKGFKQSSDLKKHRRTHTLDKPYKCPICPSAFTRSHHCRGHINSVHKFYKCGVCSALFTTEEAFEQHKELHPSFFSDQSKTSSDIAPPDSSAVVQVSAPQDTKADDTDMHEKNLKWDVANQLLELHKVSQHVSSLKNANGCGSETASESGDKLKSSLHRSSEVVQNADVTSQPSCTVNPTLTYQATSTDISSFSHMTSPFLTPVGANQGGGLFTRSAVVKENSVATSLDNSQTIPQGVEYHRMSFQNPYFRAKNSLPITENGLQKSLSPFLQSPSPGKHFPADTLEQRELVLNQIYDVYSKMKGFPHQQVHFVLNPVSTSQNWNFIGHSPRGEKSQPNAEVQNPQGNNKVPCHRVSVIQYHSSESKLVNELNNEEHLPKNRNTSLTALPLSKECESTRSDRKSQIQELSERARPMKEDFFPGFSQDRAPYVPVNSDSLIGVQSSHQKLDEPLGKYCMALKEAVEIHEKAREQEHAKQVSLKQSAEIKRLSMLSEGNAQPITSTFDRLHVTSVDMLKFLAREQIRQGSGEGDMKSPPSGGEESEASEAHKTGDVALNGQVFMDEGENSVQQNSSEQNSPEGSVHHCQVCKKTFSRSSLLKQHSVIHMGNKRFKFRCEVCSKMFRTRSHLRDHTRIHTGERPFKCHICEKAFKQSSDLKKHINLHTGANQFKCEECNMEFRRADALRKHKLGHKMGNMPCGHCGKNFMHISALRQHRAMHNVQPVKTNRTFHRCNYCFKTFTKAESYKLHMEEHIREQSITLFDCKICSLKFFSKAEFTDHMNIHNGKRPYKCFICEKEFCIAEHLQDHVRLHTDVPARISNNNNNCEC